MGLVCPKSYEFVLIGWKPTPGKSIAMDLFSIVSVIIVLSALFGYINVRFLKLPNTIGLMVIAIVFTLLLLVSSYFSGFFLDAAKSLVEHIDFEEVLLKVLLGFLLFAGALHTNFDQLHVQRWPVLIFSTVGVLASTFLVAAAIYFIFPQIGFEPKFIYCLLFGALISPTDPIAVLGILKKAGVPKILETKIVGESLFNDGVGVVVFLTISAVAFGPSHGHGKENTQREVQEANQLLITHASFDQEEEPIADPAAGDEKSLESNQPLHSGELSTPSEDNTDDSGEEKGTSIWDVIQLFVTEVFGGILLGGALGYVTFWLLRSIDDYEIEVMITLACVMGGYSLATWLDWSAPLAIVVAGLIVGNDTVRETAMSAQTEQYVDRFWELVDMLMNAILFVLIGLEMLILKLTSSYINAALIAIVVVLVARFVSLMIPVRFFQKKLQFVPHTTTVMTWGGLRGGISIALALSLPHSMNHGDGEMFRDLFVTVTYGVVVFSIIVQGLSVGKLAKFLIGSERQEPETEVKH